MDPTDSVLAVNSIEHGRTVSYPRHTTSTTYAKCNAYRIGRLKI